MGHIVVKIGDDRYLVWSTVVDAPITYGMSRGEMKEHLSERTPVELDLALEQAERRLVRADDHGTSSMMGHESAEELMTFNRAGPGKSCLPVEDLIRQFWSRPDEQASAEDMYLEYQRQFGLVADEPHVRMMEAIPLAAGAEKTMGPAEEDKVQYLEIDTDAQ